MKKLGVHIILFCLLGSWACEIINPADPVPSYIEIIQPELVVEPNEGSGSQKITESWLYVNGEFLGAYPAGAKVPVIAEGTSEVIIFPGIRINGIKSNPDIYPFYKTYTTTIDLVKENVHPISPVISYKKNAIFSFTENFEFSNILGDDLDPLDESKVLITEQDVFEGNRSAIITLTPEVNRIEVATSIVFFDIPLNGGAVYLEMDYKNEVEFAIGVRGVPGVGTPVTNYFFILNKKEEWNKIYIDLTEQIALSGFEGYQIAFQAVYDSNAGENSNIILMDNLKLVHF